MVDVTVRTDRQGAPLSGLEAAGLAGGGRLLGGMAVAAGRKLARRATFRWQVWRRVRKRVDFSFPGRTYRKWLKTVTAEDLDKPVEEIQGELARRLDEALSAASRAWVSADNHLSRSLRLVELTYPAIAAALGDADRTALSESWARQRSVTVRDLLLQLVGPGAALSSGDLAMVLHQRSEARRAVRLQAFGLDEAALTPYFDQIEIPNVPAGGVVVLLGDFGAGKSETAETWHRAGIKKLAEGNPAPFPVWLSARDLLGQTLEDAVDRQLGDAWRHGPGASITIDGLDETDPATAQNLLDAARTLVRTSSNAQVLVTARPGILNPTETERTTAALLAEDEALKLVELAGGKPQATWRWTTSMRATVRRPFFALAAGVMLGRDEAPRGEADLIRGLVEGALARGTERSTLASDVTRSVLSKLAISLTRTGDDGLLFSDRLLARSSRLVADGPQGSVRFALPIFQHWFAAQAILDGDIPANEVVADALTFSRWGWAAAVAALSAPGGVATDELLATWVAGNPGAAAWIINEAFSGHRDWRGEGDEDLDASTTGARLLRALRTWTDSLGPLAEGVLPSPAVGGPVGLGVSVSGPRLSVAFSITRPSNDFVTAVPQGVHPLLPDAVPCWRPWFSGVAPQGDAWPWTMVQKHIAKNTLKKLANDPLLGAPDGIWVQERRFDLARSLLDRGSLFLGDLDAEEVRRQAVVVLDAIGWDPDTGVRLRGSKSFVSTELQDLVSWIDATDPVRVVSHLPDKDVPRPAGGWVWNLYSSQRLLELEVEVYGRASEAYDEALAHSFARLGWSLPSSALAPFGVVLEVRFDDADPSGTPSLTEVRVPMDLLPQLAPSGPGVTWSTSGRAVATHARKEREPDSDEYVTMLETVRSWLAERNLEPIGGLGWTDRIADDMSEVRPASSVAAQWLWADLKSLGLGEGTFPQLK